MKVKNRISNIVIEVTQEHYDQVLSRQGWLEVEEVEEEVSLISELKKEVEKKKETKES
tara:strand:- start:6528 stop:6701 length:174 start_codon:yes stop_codon:yes gene_type:complete